MRGQSQTVMVSKLRSTSASATGRIEQIFDVVNCPGIVVICISGMGEDGELVPISQTYEVGGHQFDHADDALLAWGELEEVLHQHDRTG